MLDSSMKLKNNTFAQSTILFLFFLLRFLIKKKIIIIWPLGDSKVISEVVKMVLLTASWVWSQLWVDV